MRYINRPEAERMFNRDKDVYLVSVESGKAVKVNRASIARFFGVAKTVVTLFNCVKYGYDYLGKIRYSSYVHPEQISGSWTIQAMKQRARENGDRAYMDRLNNRTSWAQES